MLSFKKIENIHLWTIKLIIFIIPILPLYVSSSMMFPFIAGKNFAFRILVELAAALWIGFIIANKEYRLQNSIILISILTFTFIVGLADLLGVNPSNSFWSNFERMEGYINILHLTLYFMIMKSIFRTRSDWKIYFSIVILVSVLVSLSPLVFNLGDNTLASKRHSIEYGTRLYSTIGNPPFLASYLLLASFACLFLAFNTQKMVLRVFCLTAMILNCVVIYLTATRGVILSAIVGGIIFISLIAFRRSNISGLKAINRTVLLLLFLGITIAGAFFIFGDTELVKHDQTLSRFASMFSSESVTSRFNVWRMAWNGIKERPVLGWGQENFIGIYSVNPIALVEESTWLDRAHNIIIEWLVNAGFLGLFSYLAIFGAAVFVLRKAEKKKVLSMNGAVIIFTALVTYFIQNLFTFDTINTYMIYFASLAYIDNLALVEKEEYSEKRSNIDLNKLKLISISSTFVALVCFSFVFYHLNFKPIRQSRQIIRISFSSPKDDSISSLLREFNSVLSLNTLGDFYVRQSMISVSNYLLMRQYLNQEGAVKFIQVTVEELKKDISVRSYDLEFMTSVIALFNKISVYDTSFTTFTEAIIRKCMLINPEYEWLYMVMADVNILKKEYDSAYFNVKSIADKDLLDENKQFKLALTAIYSSRKEIAEQALDSIKKVRTSKDKNILSERGSFLALFELHELAQVYREKKNYDKAIQYLNEMITIMSEKKMYFEKDNIYYLVKTKARMLAQTHIEMAEIYLIQNDRFNALKEAEKAARIDTEISAVARGLIDSINN